jgi:predicted nucleic acid-binding protein
MLAVAALPVTIAPVEVYESELAQARKLIGRRDSDDIEILALTIHLKIPLWSNDNDFEGCEIERFTTAALLRRLEIFEEK